MGLIGVSDEKEEVNAQSEPIGLVVSESPFNSRIFFGTKDQPRLQVQKKRTCHAALYHPYLSIEVSSSISSDWLQLPGSLVGSFTIPRDPFVRDARDETWHARQVLSHGLSPL